MDWKSEREDQNKKERVEVFHFYPKLFIPAS